MNGGVLTVLCDDNSVNTVTIDHLNARGQGYAQINGGQWYGDAYYTSILVLGGARGTTVNIHGNVRPLTVRDASNLDTVNIGDVNDQLFGIQGRLTIENPPGFNNVNVHDDGDPTFEMGSINHVLIGGRDYEELTGLGASAPIDLKQSDTSMVSIYTGFGGATVNVLATGVPTWLIGNSFSTTVNVGNSWDGVQDILGELRVENPPAFTTLNVNDSADGGFRTAWHGSYTPSFDNGSPWGYLDGLAPARIAYEYADTSQVSIYTGFGGATINVLATGVPTWLIGNSFNTTVNVGNSRDGVQEILGELRVENPPAFTTLNVNDSVDGGFRVVWHGSYIPSFDNGSPWGYLDGLAPARIAYEYADTSSVTIVTGIGGATVNVLATGVTTTLIGNGDFTDTVNVGNSLDGVQDILGRLLIRNPPSYTRLNINDGADYSGHIIVESVSGGTATISGLAPTDICFAVTDVNALTLTTGHGVDVIYGWQSFQYGPWLWQPPAYYTYSAILFAS